MGKTLSKLICCDKVNEPRTEHILVYRHTEIEHFKANIGLESDELGTAIKFYSLNKIK